MLNNIVDNLEQCGQQNIVQCCFHQARTGCAFFAVYPRIFSAVSRMNFKSAAIFFLKVKKLFVFYLYSHRRFSWGMNNKRIIEFGFCRISE